jgi:predicted Zn-dependent protease with MMP-like domain
VSEPELPTVDEAIDAVFDAAIERAIGRLPEAFAQRLGTVAIVIEDEPTPTQLASVGAPGLYGLYQGVPRTAFGADAAPVPSKITIFRGPLVRATRDARSLGIAVEETVLHEIAHHFGLSDARLAELSRGGH